LCYVTVAKCNYHDLLRHQAANKIQWNNLSQAADLMKNPPISVPPPEKASLMEVKESDVLQARFHMDMEDGMVY